jgi:phosphoglycerate dehydrogenase-like enzyme
MHPTPLKTAHILVSPLVEETAGKSISILATEAGWEVNLVVVSPDLQPQTLDSIDVAFFSRDIFAVPTGPSSHNAGARLFFHLLDQASHLKWLHIFSTGADRPVYREIQARGVYLTTSSGASREAVATTALAGLLALNKRLLWHLSNQRDLAWRAVPDDLCPAPLDRQTAVIIGTGHIGAELAKYLRALGIYTIGINRSGRRTANFDETWARDRLSACAGKADWLIICCPLTDETRNLVGADVLARLPSHANLINVGRGGIVDEQALVDALRAARIAGAYLDVFDHEPLSPQSELWRLDNVIVTPHSAARVSDFNERVFKCFIDNLRRWLAGQPLDNATV